MEDEFQTTTNLMMNAMDRKVIISDLYGSLGINITGDTDFDRQVIEDMLREKNMTLEELISSLRGSVSVVLSTARSPSGGNDNDSDVSWGMIVPIVLIVIFLVCVGFCLYWHSWRDKRRKKNVDVGINTSFGKFNRSSRSTGVDHVRDSTRSTTPLRSSFREKVQVTPMQYPENQKFTFYWDNDNWKLCPPEIQARQEVNMTRVSALRQQLSPINEIDTPVSGVSDISKNYNVSAQAPFSPYHLTWVTPQAPPPSYEESEVSSPSKNTRGQSLQTTNTTQSEESCSTCVKYGKSIGSPFYPNNNTPITDYDLGSDQGSLMMKINSAMTTNNNSQFTYSYPSSPRSSTSAGSLTTSNIDTGVDASNLTSSQEPTCPPSSLQSGTLPSTNQTSERTSQTESDLSGGVPSLPSSILYYHQRMTVNNNIIQTGNPPNFSPYLFNASVGSSLESTETHYTDDTSMLPNVGSSNTSGNPTASLLHRTSISHPPVFSEPSHNGTPEDLSKIVSDLSSIRVYPNEATSINKGVINSMVGFDGNVGQSYVADIGPPHCDNGGLNGNYAQSITELFKSSSVIAELDYNSLSSRATSNTQMNDLSSMSRQTSYKEDPPPQYVHVHAEDVNHNVIDLNNLPMPGRRVTFDVPILVDKTYWV